MNQTEIYSWGQLSQQKREWTRRRRVGRGRAKAAERSFIITVAPRLAELKVVSCRGQKRKLLLKKTANILPITLCVAISKGHRGRRETTYGACSSAGCCLAACRLLRWLLAGGWGTCDWVDAEPRAHHRCCCCLRSPTRWPSPKSCCCRCCSSVRSPPPQHAALPAATDTFNLYVFKVDLSTTDGGRNSIWSSGCFLELLTSLDVIELRLGGGVILWRWGGFDADPRLDGGSEQWAGLVGANWLLLDPGLDLAAALSPKTQKMCHPESSAS